jgi:hypothetical protein
MPDSFIQLLKKKKKKEKEKETTTTTTITPEIEASWSLGIDELHKERLGMWASRVGEIYAISDGWWLDFVFFF